MQGDQDVAKPERQTPRYWRIGFVGCSVIIVFLVGLLAIATLAVYRSPYYRSVINCNRRIESAGAALDRYAIKNDAYPESLMGLAPDYLPADELYCPLVTDHSAAYSYFRPAVDTPDGAVVLECNRHRMKSNVPPIIIRYLKRRE
ncbi:MAG: hypothetical protein HYX78_08255 [Armatimonadetes bacterium]|nr:hypothetical protein [Armatimonadota bacterium]